MKQDWIAYQKDHRNLTLPVLSFPATQIFHVTIRDLIFSSDLQAQALEWISENCPTSAILILMDLSVEAECFGAEIRYHDMEVPTVIGRIITNADEAMHLKVPVVGKGRDIIPIETVRKLSRKHLGKPIFGCTIGPFSLAGRLMDMTEIMMACFDDPEMVHTVLTKMTQYLIDYIRELKKAGAKGIALAEPAAGLLSSSLCEEFSSQYVKQIADAVKDNDFLFMYHNCGNTIPLAKSIAGIGADIYHFGNAIDLEKMIPLLPAKSLIMGNLDPAGLLKNGTPEHIAEMTKELLKRCSPYLNFVISSGCDIPPTTSWNNIQAYFQAVKEYYGQ